MEGRAKAEDNMFTVSKALPPVPARLVKKGEFMDMAELLHDNAEVERRRGQLEGAMLHGQISGRANRREVPDILSWLQWGTWWWTAPRTPRPSELL